jgi:flagellar protein FlgJ
MQPAAPDLYMNMQQFSELKLQAREHSDEATRSVAQQFEGLFVQMMLKSMRAAATLDESQHSSSMDFYTDMYDKQLSQMLSKQGGGIGIADLLYSQMQGQMQGADAGRQPAATDTVEMGSNLPQYRLPVQPSGQALPIPGMNYVAQNPAVKTHALGDSAASPVTTVPAHADIIQSGPAQLNKSQQDNAQQVQVQHSLESETLNPFYGWDDAKTFVTDLWPHADKAAKELGVSAQVLVAQSALETGWGQHTMKKANGQLAFSLFGIKASDDWAGQSVVKPTFEFQSGAMQQQQARFRSYSSVAESFSDYVDFIKSRPRYHQALQHGGSDAHYIQGLHKAGYATDPVYANKVLNIMQGQTFNDALASMQTTQRFT